MSPTNKWREGKTYTPHPATAHHGHSTLSQGEISGLSLQYVGVSAISITTIPTVVLSSIHLNVDRAVKLPMVFMPEMEVFTRKTLKHKSYSPNTVMIKPYVLQKVEPIFQPFCAEATVTTGRPKTDTINSVTIKFMIRRLNSVQSWNYDK